MVLLAPYPMDRLPLVSREETARTRRLVRALGAWSPEQVDGLAVGLLGAPLRVRPGVPEALDAYRGLQSLVDPLVAVVLVVPERGARAMVEMHPRLAALLVDRALGGEGGPEAIGGGEPPAEAERGVLAYVAARMLEAAGAADWRVATVLTEAEAARALLEEAGEALVWPLQVSLHGDRGGARLWLFGAEETGAAGPPEALLARWAAVPLQIVLWGGQAELSAEDWQGVEPGDVLVLDVCGLRPAMEGWQGEAWLSVAGGERSRWVGTVREDGFHVVRRERMAGTGTAEGRTMTEHSGEEPGGLAPEESGEEHAEALSAAADAPLTIGVELARFTLTFQELAAIRPGEVVATGRPVGTEVVLRIGDRAVATGELVDVEGEVGVRILRIGD